MYMYIFIVSLNRVTVPMNALIVCIFEDLKSHDRAVTKEWKNGAAPLIKLPIIFDVVNRM